MEKRVRVREYKLAVANVSAVLHRWDPLGLGAPDGRYPASEYDAEAADIVRVFVRKDVTTADDAARIVHEIFKDSFGADSVGSEATYTSFVPEILEVLRGLSAP